MQEIEKLQELMDLKFCGLLKIKDPIQYFVIIGPAVGMPYAAPTLAEAVNKAYDKEIACEAKKGEKHGPPPSNC